MTPSELRKEERRPFDRRLSGLLLLKTPSVTYPIRGIKDVSNSGISINLDQSITPPSNIAIEYIAEKIKFEVNGMVVWCVPRQSDAAGFTLGIELFSPMLLFAMSDEG